MIDDAVRRLAKGPNFAAFTTLLPDGRPMTHVMWVDCDEEHLLINSVAGRRKVRNVEANPEVAVAVALSNQSGTGGATSAPIAKEIIEALLR